MDLPIQHVASVMKRTLDEGNSFTRRQWIECVKHHLPQLTSTTITDIIKIFTELARKHILGWHSLRFQNLGYITPMKYSYPRRVGPPGEPRTQIKDPFVCIRLTSRKPKRAVKQPNWGLSHQINALFKSPNLPEEVSRNCAGEFVRLFHVICAELINHLNLKFVWCHVGSLTCKRRPERHRRNPKSQELILLAQSNFVSFKPASKLQQALE